MLDTETVAVERVRLNTQTVTNQEIVGGQVRKEEIELDTDDRNPATTSRATPTDQLDHRAGGLGAAHPSGPRTTSPTPAVPTANRDNQHLTRGTT